MLERQNPSREAVPKVGFPGERSRVTAHGNAQGQSVGRRAGRRTRYIDIQETGCQRACPPGKPRRGTRDVVVYPETARRCTGKTMEVRGNLRQGAAREMRANPKYLLLSDWSGAERSGCEELHRHLQPRRYKTSTLSSSRCIHVLTITARERVHSCPSLLL
jgi:hypothetical protein